jgi:hypothetical protein
MIVLTPAEHLLNICTLASGMIVSPQNPIGTIGDDAMLVYHQLLDAYEGDATMPQAFAAAKGRKEPRGSFSDEYQALVEKHDGKSSDAFAREYRELLERHQGPKHEPPPASRRKRKPDLGPGSPGG